MDFKQIEAFIAVSKYKSFSRAADAIFLSQPTVSTHVAALENELNITLFDRNGKEVDLTPSGTVFLDYAINMVNTRNSALSHILNLNNKVSGVLSIVSSSTPCRSVLPKLIKTFVSKYPDVLFDIKESSDKEVINLILSNMYSIGFCSTYEKNDHLGFKKIVDDHLIVISNISNLPYYIQLEDIMCNKFVLREKDSPVRDTFESFVESKGISLDKLNIGFETNSTETIIQLVKNNACISVLPESTCADYIKSGIIKKHVIKDLNIPQSIYMVYHKRRTLSPVAEAFFSFASK